MFSGKGSQYRGKNCINKTSQNAHKHQKSQILAESNQCWLVGEHTHCQQLPMAGQFIYTCMTVGFFPNTPLYFAKKPPHLWVWKLFPLELKGVIAIQDNQTTTSHTLMPNVALPVLVVVLLQNFSLKTKED